MTFEESAPERKLPEKTPEPSYSPMKLSLVVKEPEPVIIEEEILPNEADHGVPPELGMPETAAPVSDTPEPEAVSEEIREERVPMMYPIGQMHGTYILAQNETVCISLTSMRPKNGLNTNISGRRSGRLSLKCRI